MMSRVSMLTKPSVQAVFVCVVTLCAVFAAPAAYAAAQDDALLVGLTEKTVTVLNQPQSLEQRFDLSSVLSTATPQADAVALSTLGTPQAIAADASQDALARERAVMLAVAAGESQTEAQKRIAEAAAESARAAEAQAQADAANNPQSNSVFAYLPSGGSGTSGDSGSAVEEGTPTGSGWRKAVCSWYGPGFYGRHTASGPVLTENSMLVAHKTLPFGTKVKFYYRGRSVVVPVRDRGPYIAGREFDLGPGVAKALGFDGVHTLLYRIVR